MKGLIFIIFKRDYTGVKANVSGLGGYFLLFSIFKSEADADFIINGEIRKLNFLKITKRLKLLYFKQMASFERIKIRDLNTYI